MLSTSAMLPDSGRSFPDTLWNIRFGMNYSHLFVNDWLLTMGVNLGSSSDKPFDTWRELNFGINAMLRVPQGERNAWVFSLSYSPLGQIAFPIPGIAFQWQANDWVRVNLGLPFS